MASLESKGLDGLIEHRQEQPKAERSTDINDSADAPTSAVKARGLMKLAMGKPKLALAALGPVCKANEKDDTCWLYLGWAQARVNHYPAAVTSFTAALKAKADLTALTPTYVMATHQRDPVQRSRLGPHLGSMIIALPVLK